MHLSRAKSIGARTDRALIESEALYDCDRSAALYYHIPSGSRHFKTHVQHSRNWFNTHNKQPPSCTMHNNQTPSTTPLSGYTQFLRCCTTTERYNLKDSSITSHEPKSAKPSLSAIADKFKIHTFSQSGMVQKVTKQPRNNLDAIHTQQLDATTRCNNGATTEQQRYNNEATTDQQRNNNGTTTEQQRNNNEATTEQQRNNNKATTEQQRSNNGTTTKQQRNNNKATTEQQRINNGETTKQQRRNNGF